MISCHDPSFEVQLYLDGELTESSEREFLTHVGSCAICRQELESAKALASLISSERSTEKAPAALRARIEQLIEEQTRRGERAPLAPRHGARLLPFSWTPLQVGSLAAMLLVLVGGLLAFGARKRAQSRSFVDTAVDVHRGLVDAGTQLDVRSSSPQDVAAWFSPRVPFHFRIPDSGIAAESHAKYELAGGRLVTFDGQRAALLVFQMQSKFISVLIASDQRARARGGHVFRSNNIDLHTMDRDTVHTVTWDTEGLTYALIWDHALMNKSECGSCHSAAEQPSLQAAVPILPTRQGRVVPTYLWEMPSPPPSLSQVATGGGPAWQ